MFNFATAAEQKALSEEICKAFEGGPESRSALAKKITKELQNDVDQRDLSGFIFDKEFIPLGTQVEWTLKGKMRVYWHEPGSYAPRTAVVQKVFTMTTEMLSAHPEFEITQLRSGRYGTIADQATSAREAILGAINARVWNTLVGSVPTSGVINYAAAAGGITKTALDTAITYCNDQVGGGARAIVARQNLLDKILDFNINTYEVGVFDDATKREIVQTGKIRTYRGVPLIGLPQWKDAYGRNTISNSDIMVVGGGSGKFAVTQNLESMDDIDIDTLVWHMHMWTKVGVAVFFPERNYRINVVS
jgi:hypothetical protein